MLALAHVLDLFAHELTRLRRRRLALPPGPSCALEGFAFWHVILVCSVGDYQTRVAMHSTCR
jgi:hypothetical protein